MKIKTLLIAIFSIVALLGQVKDTTTSAGIIERYINAIGGREKLAAVEDRITEMSGLVQEITVKMTIYQKRPDLFKQVTDVGEIEQTVLYDGTRGEMKINAERKAITGAELEKLKAESNMTLLLEKDTSKIRYEYVGHDTVNGKDVYKVLAHVGNTTWTQFYDVKSGFKVKDEKPVSTPQGSFVIETWYTNYKEVDGLWFPFTLKQQVGKQAMDFAVSSIKINPGIKDSLFILDEQEKK